ncbi:MULTISPECIES: invasion associated locus B family protein [Bradyrhizobium]|uniref:Invasion associated locus B family protein n=1 Tax=Bradyrhizobium diversitatis TaxID=2755406 RepID=A0ABS0PAF2_9BRAD|nr:MULTISPECIES: invasion associated locus B family protein [Bradyrhizobium]MBH5390274.1 invasion associated locus B family protein [Bradyrhizobium diversitatis]UPJ67714.1 invasion associated locus B family protein [Bradyrhizobium sp. 191]
MITARYCLSAWLTATIVTTAPVVEAVAREKPRAAKPAEVAPRGQREAKDITYGIWRKLCFKAGGARTLCRTSMTGTFPTGQTAVRVDLIERDGDRNERLQVFVPVGMYLQHPVKLTVDQGNSYHVPYSWCLSNACIAADVADPGIIRDMEAGKALLLEVVDSNLLSLTTSLPLAQFGSVHKGAPAQMLEQDINE